MCIFAYICYSICIERERVIIIYIYIYIYMYPTSNCARKLRIPEFKIIGTSLRTGVIPRINVNVLEPKSKPLESIFLVWVDRASPGSPYNI